ncbi:MAG: 16S rRNA (uracil(1498)-N(3))-methyltransferase [Neisseria sp.]|uniref:16S rRNA (uracil(1498)-N(3))-methyltransferase n=1 Tax=Neisseria sp. TaxID=192066 RepID=UPI0026DC88BD|nr:16S rRNA (uracil(1498)-N(3))-methyltransferase [Neisseria sp.]MDO4248316.1 16S rRNA (uracil(1498)-N(3))-methyltransferase [Neisseria sp.]
MPRFYINGGLSPESEVALPDNVVRHIHVLRLREGSEVVLFNGNGCAYPAQLQRLDKRSALAKVLRQEAADKESSLDITLVQAVSGGDRMDFTLQKSVELGVGRIIPVWAARSIVKLDAERAGKRVARWQEIVVSACEQSGRNVVPPVLPPAGFGEMLQCLPESDVRLLLGPNRAQSLCEAAEAPRKIVFMVGPEGGWTPEEEALALAADFRPVLLGKRILRTETAALAAIAAMQTLWGDFV